MWCCGSERHPQGLRPAREPGAGRLHRAAQRCALDDGMNTCVRVDHNADRSLFVWCASLCAIVLCCVVLCWMLNTTDPEDPYRLTDQTRNLGLVVCRGPQVSLISPVFGTEEIENPFV